MIINKENQLDNWEKRVENSGYKKIVTLLYVIVFYFNDTYIQYNLHPPMIQMK